MQLQEVKGDLDDALRRTTRIAEEERDIREDHEERENAAFAFAGKEASTYALIREELERVREELETLRKTYQQLAHGFTELAMQDRLDELKEAFR